ncbi:helix-turn-helix domain-containing protein [Brevibacillus porteri]|uniref:helix-turn-helix domain-containing protein n=1 Tax=Brevibacillus porteri TaxID=2126350 RepID=UPI0036347871
MIGLYFFDYQNTRRGVVLMQMSSVSRDNESKLNLRTIRCIRGLSLTDVANRINVSVNTLSKYERNPEETPLNVAVKLMKLYQCPFSLVQFQSESNMRNDHLYLK